MMALGVAGIPFEKWVKFVWKFLLMQYAIGAVFIIIAQCIGLQEITLDDMKGRLFWRGKVSHNDYF